jgi:hypothetical protein
MMTPSTMILIGGDAEESEIDEVRLMEIVRRPAKDLERQGLAEDRGSQFDNLMHFKHRNP